MQNHTLSRRKNQHSNLSLPSPGPASTPEESIAMRGAVYLYIKQVFLNAARENTEQDAKRQRVARIAEVWPV